MLTQESQDAPREAADLIADGIWGVDDAELIAGVVLGRGLACERRIGPMRSRLPSNQASSLSVRKRNVLRSVKGTAQSTGLTTAIAMSTSMPRALG